MPLWTAPLKAIRSESLVDRSTSAVHIQCTFHNGTNLFLAVWSVAFTDLTTQVVPKRFTLHHHLLRARGTRVGHIKEPAHKRAGRIIFRNGGGPSERGGKA